MRRFSRDILRISSFNDESLEPEKIVTPRGEIITNINEQFSTFKHFMKMYCLFSQRPLFDGTAN